MSNEATIQEKEMVKAVREFLKEKGVHYTRKSVAGSGMNREHQWNGTSSNIYEELDGLNAMLDEKFNRMYYAKVCNISSAGYRGMSRMLYIRQRGI